MVFGVKRKQALSDAGRTFRLVVIMQHLLFRFGQYYIDISRWKLKNFCSRPRLWTTVDKFSRLIPTAVLRDINKRLKLHRKERTDMSIRP